eukprot:gnl/MRDRNA2_/MRDRNA2_16862_c0_seq1.p1 gnl/MRDRNA2_/MRDRNA2_16862_c0~~gnl/MRDRNA2_/MRDRNA2_16862_c0_seq1.p1  ORF type:complete len:618 (-),score=71.34 gnl/MRDRNA2_/MRDRNA2_16862_c0_seq1:249-2039(-)
MFDAPATKMLWVLEEVVMNTIFLVDLIIAFLTGFFEFFDCQEPDSLYLVLDLAAISQKYLKSWFLMDLVASFPFSWLIATDLLTETSLTWRIINVLQMLRGARAFRFAKLIRTLQLAKLKTWMDVMESFIEARPQRVFAWTLFRIVGVLMFVTHINACLWYAVGEMYEGVYPPLPDGTPSSWTQVFIPEYITKPQEKYVYALHFALATLTSVGYGDISPTNIKEHIFTLFLLVNSAVIFAGVLTILNSLIAQLYDASNAKRVANQQLMTYMQWRNLPHALQRTVKQYFLYVWENDKEFAQTEKQIIASLSPHLQVEVCYSVYGKVLCAAPFFNWVFADSQHALKTLALKCQSCFFVGGDVIFDCDEVHATIYFLLRGRVHVEVPGTTKAEDSTMSEGQDSANNSIRSGGRAIYDNAFPSSPASSVIKFATRSDFIWQDAAAKADDLYKDEEHKRSEPHQIEGRGTPPNFKQYPVDAPAFFGESCLWHDGSVEKARLTYSLNCLKQCECVTLERTDVFDVIHNYPRVERRFHTFRDAIRTSTRNYPEQHVAESKRGWRTVNSDTVFAHDLSPPRFRYKKASCIKNLALNCERSTNNV